MTTRSSVMRNTIAALVLFAPAALFAQRGVPAPRPAISIPIAKGSGDPEGVRRPETPEAPPSLSLDQFRQLLAPVGAALSSAQGPWKVTPGSPTAGKVSLWFIEAQMVLPAANLAAIHGDSGGVMVAIRPSAVGEQHVVDCLVQPATPGYRLKGAGGFTQTFDKTNHVSFLHTSTDGKPAAFKIERAFSIDTWYFFGCEVKLLQ